MVKLKKMRLKNYCGYRDSEFDFTDENGEVKNFAVFFGANGSGKCLSGDSLLIEKESGMIRLDSLFKDFNLVEDSWYSLCKPIEVAINGEYKPVSKIYYNGRQKAVSIVTSNGYSIKGSKDRHKVLAVKNGKIDWLKISELNKGDFVIISRKNELPIGNSISDDEAIVLGYLISEGYVSEKSIKFFNSELDVNKDFCHSISHMAKKEVNFTSPKSRPNYKITNVPKSLHERLDKLGITRVRSNEKTVPSSIFSSGAKATSLFLSSYFEGDGGVEGNSITCCSKSKKLMQEIHLLLLGLGIISSLKCKNSKLNYTDKYPSGYVSWRISISGSNILKFAELIGFRSTRKKEQLNKIVQKIISTKRNPNKDIIPSELFKSLVPEIKRTIEHLPKKENKRSYFSREEYGKSSNGLHCLQDNYLNLVKLGVGHDKVISCVETVSNAGDNNLMEILLEKFKWLEEDYYFDTVEKTEELKEELYDICVEEKHCYWSNGFINHNSTLLNAVQMLSNASAFKFDPNRDQSLYFNKMVWNQNYEPTAQKYKEKLAAMMKKIKANDPNNPLYANLQTTENFGDTNEMFVEGIFKTNDGDKTVVISNNGVVKNDFPDDPTEYAYYVDADHPMEMNKFQLQNTDLADVYLELAKIVYGYPCFFDKSVTIGQDEYFTDFCIEKWGTTVHHKSMSDGEKKICALLKSLSEPEHMFKKDIILVDNIEMHIYFKRHAKMFDALMKIFPTYQFIVTTHSGTMIDHITNEYEGKFLYDLEIYKKREFEKFHVTENLGMG